MDAGDSYIDDANEVLAKSSEPPLSLEEWVEQLFEQPEIGARSSQYILNAIKLMGTRTVVEEGEKKERYRFFDDPYNDGEHAVLGNTEILNRFVEDLRIAASDSDRDNRIIWFDGPTATGKSELKRCLVNGLREYSKTDEGRRYTLEWNIKTGGDGRGLAYGDNSSSDEDDWFTSPVQTSPLAVFPEDIRKQFDAELGDRVKLPTDVGLDPFSQESYTFLKDYYERQEVKDALFERITDPSHLRVRRFTLDYGRGIGVLHSEDEGTPKKRLVGSWIPGQLKNLDSRGRRNPQAFSYDGVLSQGNGGVTIVEEAGQHADLLQSLLNVPEEGRVKLDKRISLDLDTVLVVFSNPDLTAKLNQHVEKGDFDPLKALKRRLDKYEFNYLTSYSLEVELLHRELSERGPVWEDGAHDKIADPLQVNGTEFAPHTLEAAGLYDVASRLTRDSLDDDLDLVDKANLYEDGVVEVDGEQREMDEFEFYTDDEGRTGMPVTYTRDVLLSLDEDTVLPQDVLEAMQDGLDDDPLFSPSEVTEFESRADVVEEHILEQQEQDVLDGVLRDITPDEEQIQTYIENVFAWEDDDIDKDDEEAPDPLEMKVFETHHLGFSEDNYESDSYPPAEVTEFRKTEVVDALNNYFWDNRDANYGAGDAPRAGVEIIEDLLEYDWEDVRREYPDLEPSQWANPKSQTETEAVKEKCLTNLQEMFGYSAESAERTSRFVMKEVLDEWD